MKGYVRTNEIDVEVERRGGNVEFRLLTSKAKGWWEEHADGSEKWGGSCFTGWLPTGSSPIVEHVYAGAIANQMLDGGLEVV